MQEATVQRLEASNVGEPVRELLAKAQSRLLQPDAPRIPPEGLMRHLESTYLKRGLFVGKPRNAAIGYGDAAGQSFGKAGVNGNF
jgi:hypothetical protein